MANNSAGSNCSPVYSYADQIVTDGWDQFNNFAKQSYELALSQLQNLGNFYVADVPISVTYSFPSPSGSFNAPTAPTREISAFTMPDLPSNITVTVPELEPLPDAPAEPTDVPVYTAPARPNLSIPDAPDTTIQLETLVLPDAPSYNLPEVPTFVSLNLPDVPSLNLPTFDGVAPDIDALTPPQNDLQFTEVPYTSLLMNEVKSRLSAMGQGGTGLPAAVEQALFDRARGRNDQLAAQAVDEAVSEWARMGYDQPAGVLHERVERARQTAQNNSLTTNREIYIQAQTVEIENLRFFVTQGITLEVALMQTHMAVQERALRYAQAVLQASIEIFNAQIAKAQMETTIYQAKAAVFRELIQAEISKVEIYKAQIEGEMAKGQINEQLVRRYEAQLRSISALVEIYKASVEAVKARGEINVQRIEAKRAEVQVYGEQVRAYGAAWDGFKAQVEGELGNVRAAELATQRFATLAGVWQTKNNVAVSRMQVALQGEGFKLQQGDQLLRRYLGQIQAERERISAEAQALTAEAQVYQAAGSVAQAQSAAEDRLIQTQIAAINADANLQMRRGEIAINTTIQRAQLLLDSMKSLGGVAAQLAASAMSAVNLSASINSGQSNSSSCSTSFNFSGEL